MITAIIITYNEEKNIRGCIESIAPVNSIGEILIIDSNSTDKTIEIAKNYSLAIPELCGALAPGEGAIRIISTEITNITEKRKLALTKASNDWLMFIDADERLTEELQNEITELVPTLNENIAGYFINRRNYYLGKWIKHCGIYPDYHLRLFNKHKAHITERVIHEGVEVTGSTVKLNNDLLHYSVTGIEQMIDKINFYSTFEALEHFNNRKKISRIGVFTHALSAFLRVFISRKGYKEGLPGFYVSIMDSMVNFMTHLKLLKMQNENSNDR